MCEQHDMSIDHRGLEQAGFAAIRSRKPMPVDNVHDSLIRDIRKETVGYLKRCMHSTPKSQVTAETENSRLLWVVTLEHIIPEVLQQEADERTHRTAYETQEEASKLDPVSMISDHKR